MAEKKGRNVLYKGKQIYLQRPSVVFVGIRNQYWLTSTMWWRQVKWNEIGIWPDSKKFRKQMHVRKTGLQNMQHFYGDF